MKKKNHSGFDPNLHSIEYLRLLSHAFDQMDTMAGITDIDGRVVFANRSAQQHIGTTMDRVKGVYFRDSPWRNQSRKARKIADQLMAKAMSGETALVEDSIINPDGNEVQVLFSISPIRDKYDNIIGLLPEGKIITDIKDLESKLRKEKKEIQQWIDSMSGYIAKSDPNGKIINCNRSFMRAFDTCFEEVDGAYICDLAQVGSPGGESPLLRPAILGAKGGRKCNLEVKLQLQHTSDPGTYLFNASPIKDSNGRISFLSLEITDISGQVQLREQLLNKEKRYALRLEQEVSKIKKYLEKTERFNRNLVESVPIGVLYLNHMDRVVYANPKMKQNFRSIGIPKAEIVGKTIEDLGLRPANNFWQIDRTINPGKHIYGQKNMVLLKNGDPRFCLEVLSGPLITPDRDITGTVMTVNDITKRVRLETELLTTRIQAEKMSSMGLLISGVAHELNNPLTSILGCAEFLANSDNLDANAAEAAQIILKDAIRASRIVKNLLAASYKNNMDERLVNVNEIIDELIGIRFHELKQAGVRSILKLCRDIDPVLADPTQIQQVVDNMIRNSIDAITESGTGDRITIQTQMRDKWIVITFEDNGPGVDKRHRQKIFDPFFTTKKVGKGTGLGLSVVYGIIERHGGSVLYNENLGSGAQFIVRLPVASLASSFQDPTAIALSWKPASLLMADGERNLRYALKKYLTRLGCEVQTASNGRAALNLAMAKDYDMLMVSTSLPIINGFDFYEKIKELRPELLNRIIFINDDSAGCTDVACLSRDTLMLRKPFGNNDIIELFNQFHKTILV